MFLENCENHVQCVHRAKYVQYAVCIEYGAYIVQCVYRVPCTVYRVLCTVYCVQCIPCAMYMVYSV